MPEGISAGRDPFPTSMNQGKEARDMPVTLEPKGGVSLRSICPEARIFGGEDIRVPTRLAGLCCDDAVGVILLCHLPTSHTNLNVVLWQDILAD